MPRSADKTRQPLKQQKTDSLRPRHLASAAIVLPGYFSYARYVADTLWNSRHLFWRLGLIAWLILLLASVTNEQAQYTGLSEATHEAVNGLAAGAGRALAATGILFSSILTGSLTSGLSEIQDLYRSVVYFGLWLVVVWLLRHRLADSAVNVRDGLYNAGAPIIPSLIIIMFGTLQLLPLAFVVSLFAALITAGAAQNFIIIGLMIVVSLLLGVVTLYWLSSTLFAFIVATIPGTYPLAALRSARSVIAGYRLKVLLRLLWLGAASFVVFAAVMLPLLYLDAAFRIANGFVTAAVVQLLSVLFIIYGSAYMYLLYRKVIDERAD